MTEVKKNPNSSKKASRPSVNTPLKTPEHLKVRKGLLQKVYITPDGKKIIETDQSKGRINLAD